MDLSYEAQLELAASAPDDAFPEMLFEPIMNEFGDNYFMIDFQDYGQEAVQYDSRFTMRNILRIRGSTKRIDRYLEWVSLYDDYIEYLVNKYGSMDVVQEMDDAGIFKEPMPTITHRPLLRKGKIRKLFKLGIIPSFMPYGVNPVEVMDDLYRLCVECAPDTSDLEEPDIEWALNRHLSKDEIKIMERNSAIYRRNHRLEILNSGGLSTGISSNMDFIDNYYGNVKNGIYDTEFSSDNGKNSLTSMMKTEENRKYRHMGQIWDEERRSAEGADGRYFFDTYIHDREKEDKFVIYGHLQKYAGVDISGVLSGNVDKRQIKAIRAGMDNLGYAVPPTEKELKKLKKKRKKLECAQSRGIRADQHLADILLNNKIFSNGGTVRFEDMRRRSDDDDE